MSDKIYFLGTNFPQPIPLAFDITDENKILNDIFFDDGFLLIIKILMEYLPKCQQNILLVFSNFLVVYWLLLSFQKRSSFAFLSQICT